MQNAFLRLAAFGATAVVFALPAMGQDRPSSILLTRDTIIPVVIENDLSVADAREGDRFTAHVDSDRDLPFHTRLIGRVLRMRSSHRGVTADLEFSDVILPDGSRHRIDAVPCSLDEKYVRHLDDGRIVMRDGGNGGDVVGGAVGGFIVGSIVRRPIFGTFVGALVGSIAAHNDRANERLLTKGERVGALIERDAALESYPVRSSDGRFRRTDDLTPPPPPRSYGFQDSRNLPPLVPTPTGPPAGGPLAIVYEGKAIQFDSGAMPYREGAVSMVPLQRTATQLGLTVERGRDNVIYIEGEDSSVRLEQDSTDARLNGHKATLSAPVIDRNGVLYVPVEILASMKKGNLLVNGNRVNPLSSE